MSAPLPAPEGTQADKAKLELERKLGEALTEIDIRTTERNSALADLDVARYLLDVRGMKLDLARNLLATLPDHAFEGQNHAASIAYEALKRALG